jgi:hypothetical protein
MSITGRSTQRYSIACSFSASSTANNSEPQLQTRLLPPRTLYGGNDHLFLVISRPSKIDQDDANATLQFSCRSRALKNRRGAAGFELSCFTKERKAAELRNHNLLGQPRG